MIGELAALGAALSWTVSALLYNKALLKAKPISANIVRLTCTSAILLAFLAVTGKFGVLTSLPTNVFVLACVSGVIGLGLGDTMYMTSLKLIGVARAVPITCTYPLFNLLWTILLGEPVTIPIILGAVTIVFGIWLISQEEKPREAEPQKKILAKGIAIALVTAIVWSVSIAMIGIAVEVTPDLDNALAINILRVTSIAIVLLVSAPLVDRDSSFLKMEKKTVIALIAGGVVALGLGWFFLTFSFINTLESQAVPISSTTPLFSTLSGIILLKEKVTTKNALGSILIVAGIFLIFIV